MWTTEHGRWAIDLPRQGYVKIGGPDERGMVEWAHPDRTCLRVLRTGLCRLDLGHRGRHTTVAFYCDACNKMRRGSAWVNDEEVTICWFCQHVLNPDPWGWHEGVRYR